MNSELCHVGVPTPLPSALQQRYDQLSSPQCTDLTYINTFLYKMLLMTSDAEIRDILCHLRDAVSKLDRIHVRKCSTSDIRMYNYIRSYVP